MTMTPRRAPRLKTQIRIFFSGSEGAVEGEGTVADLSKTGCKVESETDVAVGTELEAWMYPPDHGWPLKIERAIVRWSEDYEFGLEFLAMLPAQRERLRLALERRALGSHPRV